jgi:hypothetical protein
MLASLSSAMSDHHFPALLCVDALLLLANQPTVNVGNELMPSHRFYAGGGDLLD